MNKRRMWQGKPADTAKILKSTPEQIERAKKAEVEAIRRAQEKRERKALRGQPSE